jgi:hypothetical protein
MGILDRTAHFREQAVDGGGQLGQRIANDARRRTGEVALLDREQAIAKRRQRACAFAVGTFGRNVANQQAEGPGRNRRDDFLIEFGDGEEGGERKDERGKAGNARQQGIADFLRRSFPCPGNRWSPRRRRRSDEARATISTPPRLNSRG